MPLKKTSLNLVLIVKTHATTLKGNDMTATKLNLNKAIQKKQAVGNFKSLVDCPHFERNMG